MVFSSSLVVGCWLLVVATPTTGGEAQHKREKVGVPYLSLERNNIEAHIHSEFFCVGKLTMEVPYHTPPSSNFASKSPNKSVNQLKLAATKKSEKGGTLNKRLTTFSHKG